MSLSSKAEQIAAGTCDDCNQKKGRTHKIVHHLKFSDEEALRSHLNIVAGEERKKNGGVDSDVRWYRFINRYYGETARAELKPIWQVYLEAHGVTVRRKEQQEGIPF